MTTDIGRCMDREFDFTQWAGKEYLLERMEDELGSRLTKTGAVYDGEVLYWMGYVYRMWHFISGESSKAIYHQAKAPLMNALFLPYHTLDCNLAIEKLRCRKQSA